MKKVLLFLFALLGLGTSGVWAQTVTATLMEGYGDPLTLNQFKALAGTTGRFGFVASSNTASATSPRCDHWCKFTSTHNTTTLDEDALFYLEASGDNYKVKRSSDGLYVNTSTSSTSFGEGGTAFNLVNRDANDATKAVTGDYSISFEDPSNSNMHYNANAVKYNNGAGAWTTYAVFGPIYKVTINCKNENDEVIMTKSCFAKDGTTVNAPEIEGMVLQGNASVTVNGADATFDATYQDNRITVLYSTSTGTFTTTGNYVHEWNSTATNPQVTFAVSGGANNIASSTGYIYSGANGCTYVLTAQNGYLITGYEIVGTAQAAAQTLTPAAGGSATEFSTEGTTTLRVTGLSVQSTSFTQSTPNNGIAITSFKIFLAPDPDYVDWTPSIEGAFVKVGDKVSSFSTVSAANDNSKWYILTQVRGGETPMYDAGTGNTLKRAGTSITAASLDDTQATASAAYLIRFVAATDEGTYNIQFANGNWITSDLKTSPYNCNAGTYAFYNSNGGDGSYFAWNLNSKSGSRVDNNAAGNTLAFWGSGETSGTSGNNIWYLYETEFEVPAATVDVTYSFEVGGNVVKTETVTVPANSEISIPNGLMDGYSSDYFNFTTKGTIGEENCTITVTGTLIYSDVVYPYTNISNSKSYYLKTINGQRDALSTYTAEGTTYLASPVKQALGIAPKPFAILNYEGNYYLYSVEDKKFVTYSAEQAAPLADVIIGTSDRVTFSPTVAPLYELRFDGSASKIINSSSSYTYGLVFNGWGSSTDQWDEGCQYSIDEAEDFDPTEALAVLEEFFHPSYTVTYVVKDADDNTLFTSDPVGTTLGATITELPAEYKMDAFYTYNTVDITVSNLNTTASFIATPKENPLVKYTADATSPVWYKLKLKDANYPTYVANVAEGEYNVQTPTTANDDATTYQWAFIGEPYAGFQMINRAAGTSLVLGSATTIGIGDTGASVKATLAAPSTQDRDLWYLSPSSYLSGGFFLFNTDGHALNQRGTDFLAYWTDGADLGSTFTVTEVHEGEALFNDLIAQLKAYPYGAGVNQYSMIVEGYDYTSQAATIINGLKTAGCTDENLTNAQLMLDGTSINLPPAGFYRIKGYSGNYITSNTAGSNAAMNGTASANNIVYYSAEKNLVFFGSGYGLYNTSIVARAGETLNTYEFTQGAQIGKYYVASNASGMGTYCYDNTANGTKVDRNGAPVTSGDFQTDWTLEAVTTLPVTISTAKYATLYAPVALTIPDGVTAYYVSALTKTEATLTEISNTIPANTGVILYADVTEETTFGFKIADEADAINGNQLAGKVAAWNVQDGEAYTLRRSADDETQVGLFMKEAGTLVGFKAYMPATPEAVQMGGSVKGFVFNFDNLTTGIVKMADGTLKLEGAPVYDLSGRKVAAPTKGIYVVNGKKVAIK